MIPPPISFSMIYREEKNKLVNNLNLLNYFTYILLSACFHPFVLPVLHEISLTGVHGILSLLVEFWDSLLKIWERYPIVYVVRILNINLINSIWDRCWASWLGLSPLLSCCWSWFRLSCWCRSWLSGLSRSLLLRSRSRFTSWSCRCCRGCRSCGGHLLSRTTFVCT